MRPEIIITSFAAVAVASSDASLRPWVAPSSGDSRGPCPMLNTLANHGYLPHDGRNLTVQQFGDAVVEALNAAPSYGTVPANLFVKGWGKDHFDLEDLNTAGILQHIASLSRDDVTATEKNIEVNPNRVSALLDDSTSDHIDAKSIAKSRLRVEALSSPKKLTMKEQLLAYVESSLVLMMMKEGTVPSGFTFPSSKVWTAPKDRVRVWLLEERLPSELGWKRSERQIGVVDLFPVMSAVFTEKWSQKLHAGSWKTWIPGAAGIASMFESRDEL